MQRKGNYAVAVVWSDGHRSSIYPFERILSDDIKGEWKQKLLKIKEQEGHISEVQKKQNLLLYIISLKNI